MKILNAGCPRADGFYMPAEYAPHNGTIIIWPKRPGSWIYGAGRAREAFAEVICAIAESEQAYVLAEADVIDNARSVVEAVRKQKNYQENFPVKYIQMESDDAWARDVGPTFVKMRMVLSEESTGVLMPGAARWTDCTQTGQRMTE